MSRCVPVPQQRMMMQVIGDGIDSSFALFMPNLPWSGLGVTLAFDYGAKTIRFGSGLDTAEARQLADKITTTATRLVAN